jgi:outer membrane protein assembly factor BamB
LYLHTASCYKIIVSRKPGSINNYFRGRNPKKYIIVYPSNNALLFLDQRNLEEKKAVPVQGNSNSSPALWNGKLIHVNQNGDLLVVDPETGRTESSVATEAIQPVSLAPTLWENFCAFAGRKGTIVAVDLKKRRVMWDSNIDSGIFQDITIGKDGLYPFTGNVFHALSLKNGQRLFEPVASSCSPLYHDGMLYFGDRQRNFVVADASTGKILKRYKLDGLITTMPAKISDTVIVATETGTLYGLNPEDM